MVSSLMKKFRQHNRYHILGFFLLTFIATLGFAFGVIGGAYQLMSNEGIFGQFGLAFELFSNALHVWAFGMLMVTGAGVICFKNRNMEEQKKGALMAFVTSLILVCVIYIAV